MRCLSPELECWANSEGERLLKSFNLLKSNILGGGLLGIVALVKYLIFFNSPVQVWERATGSNGFSYFPSDGAMFSKNISAFLRLELIIAVVLAFLPTLNPLYSVQQEASINSPSFQPNPQLARLILSDREKEWRNDNRVLRFGVDPDWPPYDFVDQDGNHQGLSADYLDLISRELGVTLQRVPDLSRDGPRISDHPLS